MALSDAKVTLYDTPTRLKSRICSPFVTRIRLVLNVKKIPFDVVWVPFADIQATAKAVGARPTEKWLDGSPRYTIPFLTIESPQDQPKIVLTDSWTIAAYFEEKVPEPRLFPEETTIVDSMALQKIEDIWRTKMMVIQIQLGVDAWDKATQDYYDESRPLLYTAPWRRILPKDEQAQEAARKAVFEGFDLYATYLDKSGDGNYRFTPGRLSYTEIGLVAWLHCMKAVGGHTDLWREVEKANGGRWAKLLEVPEYSRIDSVYLRK